MQRENQRMARDKRDRENAWKNDQESNNQLEVTLTSHNEVLEMNGSIRRTDNWQWAILCRFKVKSLKNGSIYLSNDACKFKQNNQVLEQTITDLISAFIRD